MEEGGNMYEEPRGGGVPPEGREIDDAMNGPVQNGADVQLENFVEAHAEYNEEEEERKYFRRKRLGVVKNLLAASMAGMLTYGVFLGLLQMQLILHYDETYREVKYSNLGLQNIDSKMLLGISITPLAAFLYTPIFIRFFGTKWMLFLAVGIYALFVSTNYWERYYTLVPSAVAIGAAIVPLWASLGNYILRMAQKYYEHVNYKLEHVQEQKRAPRGAYNSYIITFEAVFYGFFFVRTQHNRVDLGEEEMLDSALCCPPLSAGKQQLCCQAQHFRKVLGVAFSFLPPLMKLTAPSVLLFQLSFVYAEFPMFFFLKNYLFELNHTLYDVKNCGTASHGILIGFNSTVLQKLPRSSELIIVESVLMGVAFLSMLMVLLLCGSAYRPTEEIDLRSIGWGNIFQLPFKHMRDYRLRYLLLFFIYSGFEVLFLCTDFTLNYGVCCIGLEHMAYILTAYGIASAVGSTLVLTMLRLPRQVPLLTGASIHAILLIALFCWEPQAKNLAEAPIIYLVAAFWGLGSALNKTGLSTLLGMLYEDKERQDFIFTVYHWWQACAMFVVYCWSNLPMKAKLSILLVTLVAAVFSYIWMERKIAQSVPHRLPKIPKPRHKVRGYRYLEDNSDATDSEEEEEDGEQREEEAEANEPDGPPHCPWRRRQHACGEAFGEEVGDNRG